jgi:hypothetical protein
MGFGLLNGFVETLLTTNNYARFSELLQRTLTAALMKPFQSPQAVA